MDNKGAQLEYITLAFKAVKDALACIDKQGIRAHARGLFKGNEKGIIFFEGWQDFDCNEEAREYFKAPEGPIGITKVNHFTNLLFLQIIDGKPTTRIVNLGEYLNDYVNQHHINELAHLANIENLIHALTQRCTKHVPGISYEEAEEVYKEATCYDFHHVTKRVRRGLSDEDLADAYEREAVDREMYG